MDVTDSTLIPRLKPTKTLPYGPLARLVRFHSPESQIAQRGRYFGDGHPYSRRSSSSADATSGSRSQSVARSNLSDALLAPHCHSGKSHRPRNARTGCSETPDPSKDRTHSGDRD